MPDSIPSNNEMRYQLIEAASADPEAFVDRVLANFEKLNSQVEALGQQSDHLQETVNQRDTEIRRQAELIANLSLQKEQARKEAEGILQRAQQEASEIISDAKARAGTMTGQAETKLMQAEMEANSIITTKLSSIRKEASDLEMQRSVEQQQTRMFFQNIASEYDGMIEQCSETLSRLRNTRSYVTQRGTEVEQMKYEHFDVGQYMPQPASHPEEDAQPLPQAQQAIQPPQAMPSAIQPPQVMPQVIQPPHAVSQAPQQAIQPPQAMPMPSQGTSVPPQAMPAAYAEQPVPQVPQVFQPAQPEQEQQPVATADYDEGGIMPSKSFNDYFKVEPEPALEPEPEDDFGDDFGDDFEDTGNDIGFDDSGLLMEAMDGMGDTQPSASVPRGNAPTDSGLLFEAMNDMESMGDDDFDDFEDMPPQPQQQMPRRGGRTMPRRGGGSRKGWL